MNKLIRYGLVPSLFLNMAACIQYDASPVLKAGSVTLISNSDVTLSAQVNANDQVTTVTFEIGTSFNYDKIVHPFPDKIGGNEYTTVTGLLTDLNPDTRYHYRIKATSLCGTTISPDRTFVTSMLKEINFSTVVDYGSVKDYDGNIYRTVRIGNQEWMAENLKVTHLNNGKPVQQVTDNEAWSLLTAPGYCWYNNDPDILNAKCLYGALYNYFSVETGRLCPRGWHVPTDGEWYQMVVYLGGYESAGGKLKESGSDHWRKPNAGADNGSGFTALPGGKRLGGGNFVSLGYYGHWWTSLDPRTNAVWSESIRYDFPSIISVVYPLNYGYSVRCVKD